MFRYLIIFLITLPVFAEDFPEPELRRGYAQNLIIRTLSQLKNEEKLKSGLDFDPAKAMAACDNVDKSMKDEILEKRRIFYAAKDARKSGKENWDKELRENIEFGGAAQDGKPLNQTIRAHLDEKWPCASSTFSMCNDPVSMELLNNLASDPGIIDETIFSTCVRLIKYYKKAGTCTYSQEVADKACSNVGSPDVRKAKPKVVVPINP
ncbi:MAG: hypothetical protein K2P81_17190 [Bacteriovoracaceae bacterium]|nr:hypothetical protein [Bacteriovoracaceae bacterium]